MVQQIFEELTNTLNEMRFFVKNKLPKAIVLIQLVGK